MERYTIFISDLHLSNYTPETNACFLKFLNEIGPEVDAIYILGDFFQFWVGDDDRSPFNEEIKKSIKTVSNKIPVYLMPGNRDFLLGEKFANESGCILLSDPSTLLLYGIKTILTHGDLLCTKDSRYRIFRNIIRFPYALKIFLKLPLSWRLWLASTLQKHSAKARAKKSKTVLSAQTPATKKLLVQYNADQIIHGHTHDIEVEELNIDTKKTRRISLGEWDKQGLALVYYQNHSLQFKKILV